MGNTDKIRRHRTNDVSVYDFRTNVNITLVTNSLNDDHLKDFIECYSATDVSKRKETWSEENPDARWKSSLMTRLSNVIKQILI